MGTERLTHAEYRPVVNTPVQSDQPLFVSRRKNTMLLRPLKEESSVKVTGATNNPVQKHNFFKYSLGQGYCMAATNDNSSRDFKQPSSL